MSILAPRDCSPIAADEVIKRDIAAACAALLKKPSGPLIAATLVHAPEDVIARIQARDAHYLNAFGKRYLEATRGSSEEQSRILEQYPRYNSQTVKHLVAPPLIGFLLASVVSQLSWSTVGVWPMVASVGLTGSTVPFIRRWLARDPLRLTRAQQSALMTPVSEGGWSLSATDSINQKSMASPALGMVLLARAVVADIRSSPAWLDPTMNDNWIRLDLDRELTEITLSARTLSQMRDHVVEPTPDNGSDLSAGAAQQWRQAYETLYASIIGRLAALKDYRDDLTSVEVMLVHQVAVRQIQGTSRQIDDSLIYVALCDAAVTEMEARSFELADVKANLAAQNAFLDLPLR